MYFFLKFLQLSLDNYQLLATRIKLLALLCNVNHVQILTSIEYLSIPLYNLISIIIRLNFIILVH